MSKPGYVKYCNNTTVIRTNKASSSRLNSHTVPSITLETNSRSRIQFDTKSTLSHSNHRQLGSTTIIIGSYSLISIYAPWHVLPLSSR
jgi:hypothetical protein